MWESRIVSYLNSVCHRLDQSKIVKMAQTPYRYNCPHFPVHCTAHTTRPDIYSWQFRRCALSTISTVCTLISIAFPNSSDCVAPALPATPVEYHFISFWRPDNNCFFFGLDICQNTYAPTQITFCTAYGRRTTQRLLNN